MTPLVVLQAAEEDDTGTLDRRVAQVVEFVRQGHQPRGLIAKRLDGGGGADAYSSAIDMVRQLCEHPWDNQNQSQYKAFGFPRSRLLRAIEQAAPEVGGDVGTVWSAAQRRERLMRRLAELRWRPGRDTDGTDEERRVSAVTDTVGAVVNPSGFVGAMFIACLSVLLGEGGWQTAVWGGALALAAFGVVHLLMCIRDSLRVTGRRRPNGPVGGRRSPGRRSVAGPSPSPSRWWPPRRVMRRHVSSIWSCGCWPCWRTSARTSGTGRWTCAAASARCRPWCICRVPPRTTVACCCCGRSATCAPAAARWIRCWYWPRSRRRSGCGRRGPRTRGGSPHRSPTGPRRTIRSVPSRRTPGTRSG